MSRPRRAGFTLLEIVVVVAVIAVISGAVLLSARGSAGDRAVEDEAQRMFRVLQLMCDEAVVEGRFAGFGYALDKYSGYQLDPNGWRTVERSGPQRVHSLREGLVLLEPGADEPLPRALPEKPQLLCAPTGDIGEHDIVITLSGAREGWRVALNHLPGQRADAEAVRAATTPADLVEIHPTFSCRMDLAFHLDRTGRVLPSLAALRFPVGSQAVYYGSYGASQGPHPDRSHAALRRALVLWATEPEIVAPGELNGVMANAFEIAGPNTDLLRLYVPRALALIAAFPNRANCFPTPERLRKAASEAFSADPKQDLPADLRKDLHDGMLALARAIETALAAQSPEAEPPMIRQQSRTA